MKEEIESLKETITKNKVAIMEELKPFFKENAAYFTQATGFNIDDIDNLNLQDIIYGLAREIMALEGIKRRVHEVRGDGPTLSIYPSRSIWASDTLFEAMILKEECIEKIMDNDLLLFVVNETMSQNLHQPTGEISKSAIK